MAAQHREEKKTIFGSKLVRCAKQRMIRGEKKTDLNDVFTKKGDVSPDHTFAVVLD